MMSSDRLIVLWAIALLTALATALFVWLLRRFGLRKSAITVSAVSLALWLGLAGWIEWDCAEAMAVPGHFEFGEEGRAWRDNDGTVRSLMLGAGIVLPFALLCVLATVSAWIVSPRRQAQT